MKTIAWFHRMEIAPGVWTPGVKTGTESMLSYLHMPEDLTGRSVLDVGAWDGFYSFEAERRGAARVLATDSFCWGGDGWGSKAGFLFARDALKSKVEDLDIDCMDIAPDAVGTFDVVLFLGVLYHLKNPLEALERIASVTNELLIVETLVDTRSGDERPLLTFYPGGELDGDTTSWFGPNICAVEAMLRVAGFHRIETLHVEPVKPQVPESRWLRTLARLKARAASGRSTNMTRNSQEIHWQDLGRAAFHAWK